MGITGKTIVAASLIVVGIIHLLPVMGLAGDERLSSLYGVRIDDPNLSILMRHRAVLFGLLGLFCVIAAFRPELQLLALCAGAVSVASFFFLACSTGSFNAELERVIVADAVAAVSLALGFAAYFATRPGD